MDNEFIRVLVRPHIQTAALDTGRPQDRDGPHGGVHAGTVAVVAENHRFSQTLEELRMPAGECRSQGCHGAVKARLMQGDHVHVSFAEKEIRTAARARQIQAVQVAAFIKDRGLRGI